MALARGIDHTKKGGAADLSIKRPVEPFRSRAEKNSRRKQIKRKKGRRARPVGGRTKRAIRAPIGFLSQESPCKKKIEGAGGGSNEGASLRLNSGSALDVRAGEKIDIGR